MIPLKVIPIASLIALLTGCYTFSSDGCMSLSPVPLSSVATTSSSTEPIAVPCADPTGSLQKLEEVSKFVVRAGEIVTGLANGVQNLIDGLKTFIDAFKF